MNPPPLPLDIQRAITLERLRLLSWAFYISGAIGIVMVSFLLIHLAVLTSISFNPASIWPSEKNTQGAPPVGILRTIALFIGLIILIGWTLGGLTAFAGKCISQRKHRRFILIMSGINCIWIPYGTLLGVLAIMCLSTPHAKEIFLSENDITPQPRGDSQEDIY